ncbi:MAG: hypothetical protein JXB46_05570 [Candidatus Eisenbacteria bacterium]|nr:hypothetical protein [Candidatus Eisenbacteria bacterium]
MQVQLGASRVEDTIREAAHLIRSSRHLTAFTGAGISVESGIPPFRGPGGLWTKYDPRLLELSNFLAHPDVSWPVLKEIFYDHFGAARPNRAHEVLAAWEARGLLSETFYAAVNPIASSRLRRSSDRSPDDRTEEAGRWHRESSRGNTSLHTDRRLPPRRSRRCRACP